ncbi:MAG TPA: hypothetical protein DDY32_02210 [Desulfobulbaceae bacterium]|nr:hypothetical protein [Desulfobulbaceae bacterium]
MQEVADCPIDQEQPQPDIADYQYLYQRFPTREPLTECNSTNGSPGDPGADGKTPDMIGKVDLEGPFLYDIHNVGTGNKKKEDKEDHRKGAAQFCIEKGKMNYCAVDENTSGHHNCTGTGRGGNILHKENPDHKEQHGKQYHTENLKRSCNRPGNGNPDNSCRTKGKNRAAFRSPDIQELHFFASMIQSCKRLPSPSIS